MNILKRKKIEKNITYKEIASKIGKTTSYVSDVISQNKKSVSFEIIRDIGTCLGIEKTELQEYYFNVLENNIKGKLRKTFPNQKISVEIKKC